MSMQAETSVSNQCKQQKPWRTSMHWEPHMPPATRSCATRRTHPCRVDCQDRTARHLQAPTVCNRHETLRNQLSTPGNILPQPASHPPGDLGASRAHHRHRSRMPSRNVAVFSSRQKTRETLGRRNEHHVHGNVPGLTGLFSVLDILPQSAERKYAIKGMHCTMKAFWPPRGL